MVGRLSQAFTDGTAFANMFGNNASSLSGTVKGKVTQNSDIYEYYMSWSATQDKSGNFSTVTATLYYSRTNTGYTTYGAWSGSITINGVKTNGTKDVTITYNSNTAAMSATVKVPHNADGTKSITISASGGISGTSFSSTSISKSVTLDTIPRASTISATIADIGSNTTITINSASNNFTHTVTYAIGSLTGTIATKTIANTIIWTIPEEFYWMMINAPNGSCTLTCITYNGNTVIGTSQYSFIINADSSKCAPVLNPTVEDDNSVTIALTGDKNKLIKYYSGAYTTINASGQHGATIKTYKVSNGGASSTIIPISFANVENGTFTFSATDSRGFTTTKTVTKTLINYVNLTCNMAVNKPTVDGKTTLKVNGNYFNGSFGATNNTLTVQYRYKENDGTYGNWINATPTITNNTYSTTVNITGLNYRNAYTFQARAIDKISTGGVESAAKRVKATPVFDWGENDFKFNVDVCDKYGNNLTNEMTAENQAVVSSIGRELKETGFVSITPVANTPTSASVTFKRTYKKVPTVILSVASSVPGTQVLGYGQTGISTTGFNAVVTRINTVPTVLYFFVFGEVDE